MKKAVIFDLDGTLLDTLDSLVISVNEMLRQLHLGEINREQCRAFVGNGARVLVEKSILAVQGECSQEFLDEAVRIYSMVFEHNCMYRVTLYEGVRDLLDRLLAEHFQLAVLSNKPHERTVQMIESIFGVNYFTYVQGQIDGVPRKPDPASLEYVITQLGRSREECIYVGDSEVDMATGLAVGMTTLGVTWGFRNREILERVSDLKGYMTIVNDARELTAKIFESDC